MIKISTIFAVVLISCMSIPRAVHAVSWSPLQEERAEKTTKEIKEKGDIVCLFQSGTTDVKKEIRIDDILIVFREGRGHASMEVGKIKILSYVGEDYLKGEVMEGEVKAGDIAKKGDVASLIISSEDKCK